MNYTMQSLIKEYVNSEGKEELFNEEKLIAFLNNKGLPTELYRLLMVLSCDATKDFVLNSDNNISRVEINNLIMSIIRSTGMKTVVAREIVAMICYSIGVNFNYEIVISYDPIKEAVYPVVNTLEPHIIHKKLDAAQVLQNAKQLDKASEIYEELVKAGSEIAMYRLGMIYINEYEDLCDDKSFVFQSKSEHLKKGIKLLEMAAENGHVKARVELGNYHYFDDKRPDGLKKAYAMYSSPGIPSTNQAIKDRLVDILNQEKTNFLVTILGGVLTILMWVFVFVCGGSVHYNQAMIGWGILFTALPTIIYGLMCYAFYKYKYAYIKVCIFAMMLIWSCYPLILAIN